MTGKHIRLTANGVDMLWQNVTGLPDSDVQELVEIIKQTPLPPNMTCEVVVEDCEQCGKEINHV